jgi:starch synthase
MLDIEDDMLSTLKTLDYNGFIKLGMEYSDAVIKSKEDMSKSLQALVDDISFGKKVDTIDNSENFTESYLELYNELVG